MSRNLPRCAPSNALCTNTCFFLPLIVMRGRHPPSGGAAGDPRLCFGDCTLAKLHQEFTSQQCCQLYVWSGTRCGKWHLLRSLVAALLPCTSALQWGERETMQPLWRRREASRNFKKRLCNLWVGAGGTGVSGLPSWAAGWTPHGSIHSISEGLRWRRWRPPPWAATSQAHRHRFSRL